MLSRLAVTRITQFLVFLNVFIVQANFRYREFGDDSVDSQVLIKLGIWVFTFGFSVVFIKQWGQKLIGQGNGFLAAVLLMMALSCVYAPSFTYSAGCVVSILAFIGIFCLAACLMDERTLLQTVIYAVSLVCLVSLAVYYISPTRGHAWAWVNGVRVPSRRLSGITGTPNAIGYLAAVTLLLIFLQMKFNAVHNRLVMIGLIGVNLLALILSNSRTAMVAMGTCILVVQFWRFTIGRVALALFALAAVMFIVPMLDFEAIFASLSRSGDAEEILTGTGRTQIWGYVLELIAQRPFTGWGYASSQFILPKYINMAGYTPPHAHNAYLQICFSIGIFGLALYLCFFIGKVIAAARHGDKLKLTLLLFLFLTSITESSVFQGVVLMPVVVLALVVSLDYRSRYAPRYPAS